MSTIIAPSARSEGMSRATLLSDGGSSGSAADDGFAADDLAAGFDAEGAGATLPLPLAAGLAADGGMNIENGSVTQKTMPRPI